MTESTPGASDPAPRQRGSPVEQTIDGELVAPAGLDRPPSKPGLEVKARSQWDYARRRFLRHRLAMVGLVGLVIIFGAGDLRELRRAVLVLRDRPEQPPPRTDVAARITSSARTRSDATTSAVSSGGSARRRRSASSSQSSRRSSASSSARSPATTAAGRQPPDAHHRPRADAACARDPADGRVRCWGTGSQWRVSVILAFFFWTGIARVVRGVFLSLREKEYVEAAKAAGAGDCADHVPAHPPEHARPDHRQRHARRRRRDPHRGGALVPRLRHQAADAVARRARSRTGQTNPQQWWLTVFPGLTIVLIVLCVNFVGDGLRDALDPTQRRIRA